MNKVILRRRGQCTQRRWQPPLPARLAGPL